MRNKKKESIKVHFRHRSQVCSQSCCSNFYVQPETQILIGIFCTMYYSCVEVNNQVCAAGNYINDRPFLVHHSVLLWLSSSTHIHCVDCRPLEPGLCRCKINGSSSFSKQSRESCSSIHSS
jgi:hypothetical protein